MATVIPLLDRAAPDGCGTGRHETLMTRVQAAKTADDMKTVLKDAPGLKIDFEREITIEFTPAK